MYSPLHGLSTHISPLRQDQLPDLRAVDVHPAGWLVGPHFSPYVKISFQTTELWMYSPLHGLSAQSSTFVQSERGRSAVLMYLSQQKRRCGREE